MSKIYFSIATLKFVHDIGIRPVNGYFLYLEQLLAVPKLLKIIWLWRKRDPEWPSFDEKF